MVKTLTVCFGSPGGFAAFGRGDVVIVDLPENLIAVMLERSKIALAVRCYYFGDTRALEAARTNPSERICQSLQTTSSEAVSYTHLDVYKRQLPSSSPAR